MAKSGVKIERIMRAYHFNSSCSHALYNISIKQMLQTILLVLHNTLYRIAKKSAMVSGYNLIVVLRLCQQKWAERMYRYDYCHYTRIIIVPNISEMATS